MTYTTIIMLQRESNALKIYEPLEIPFNISFNDIKVPVDFSSQDIKLSYGLDPQVSNISIIKAFRSKYMCFYITLIETIHQNIIKLQESHDSNNHLKKMQENIKKFGFYCINFVKSDWVEITKSNPYRWETFFKLLNVPLKILKLEFESIKFYGRTFEVSARYKFCIFIENKYAEIFDYLKKKGYDEFKNQNDENFTAVGKELEIYIPCPSIEYFYFIFKYVCYFHLFLLFYHSFDYLKNSNYSFRIALKEKKLFEVFLPVMDEFFNVSKDSVSKFLVFKYYTLNPDELEVIYNNILVNKVKLIETKMVKYFLMKHAICNLTNKYNFPLKSHK